jgi:hypothetical protein
LRDHKKFIRERDKSEREREFNIFLDSIVKYLHKCINKASISSFIHKTKKLKRRKFKSSRKSEKLNKNSPRHQMSRDAFNFLCAYIKSVYSGKCLSGHEKEKKSKKKTHTRHTLPSPLYSFTNTY